MMSGVCNRKHTIDRLLIHNDSFVNVWSHIGIPASKYTFSNYLNPHNLVQVRVFQIKTVSYIVIQYHYQYNLVSYSMTLCYLCQ